MYKRLFITAALAAACILTDAQTTAVDFKGSGNNNPVSACVFCADPTAIEYNGRLYVYGSNDHQSFMKRGKKEAIDYGDIKSLVVFSTGDMVNWTFHGTIDVARLCSNWTGNPWYKGFMNSWAPSVVWRTTEEGKDEFFLYFANTSHGVGVLKADSPVGPWSSPLRESMINRDTPGVLPCNWIFDPGVVVDDNGTGWISFGGGDPNNLGTNLLPNNARFAKLKPSMTALDGPAVSLPAPYHFEASELNILDGKFVYTYCSSWAERTDADWNTYQNKYSTGKPDKCTMCYMVSDNPTDPASWMYKGVYGPHPGTSSNNHSHLQKFQGNYYHIYHSGALLEGMRSAKAIDSNASGYRSICVNKAQVNEATQTINPVSLNLTGVDAVCYMNPYLLQQAETMATCAGISYEDFTNIKPNSAVSTLGNDASENLQVQMSEGSWIQLRKADFGANGAAKFMLRAKGEGVVEIRLGRKAAKASASVNVSSADMTDYSVDVDANIFNGQKTFFLFVSSGTDVCLDAWQFSEGQADAIQTVKSSESVRSQQYDLSGRRLSGSHQHRGIVIEQYTGANGVRHSLKRF